MFDHLKAFFGALAANLRASFAIVQFFRVAFAFLGTGITYHSARVTQQGCVLPAHTHQLRAGTTNNCTFAGQRDAARQHLNTVFLEALGCTVLAFRGALVTQVNTVTERGITQYFGVHSFSGYGEISTGRQFFVTRHSGAFPFC